jgi:N-acetylmuramoyl-L-alanine amidase
MNKIVFLLLFILLPAAVSSEKTHYLKLRTSYHPEFLRIVLEGAESLISKGMVNQKGKDIIVRFPYTSFTIYKEKTPITYKIYKDTILFSPGYFRGFKTFSLKYPSRLVIDVYLETEKKEMKPSIKPELTKKAPQIQRIKTVVIDPGHGGYESGLITENYKEKNVVLDIAKRLRALINRGSTRGFLTRKSDQFMSLKERVKFANSKNAEIFLSLHVGSHGNIVLYTPVITEPVPYEVKDFLINKGQEDFMVKTSALRNAIQQAIVEDFGNDMVSTKPLPYSILSRIEAAALIIELPSFEDAYYVAELKTELANTIYKGLYLYEESTAN